MTPAPAPTALLPWADRAGRALLLVLPLFLLHGRGLAEALMAAIELLFLVQSAARRDWTWLRPTWVRIALVWWPGSSSAPCRTGPAPPPRPPPPGTSSSWSPPSSTGPSANPAPASGWPACSAGPHSTSPPSASCSSPPAATCSATPAAPTASSPAPTKNPRAGAPLSRLLPPAVLPVLHRWAARPGPWRLAAALLLPVSLGTMVLIGQRMPLLLTGLGLFATALLMPALRRFVLVGTLAAAALVAATSVVSPPTFARIVVKFSHQMEDFPDSHYGLIAARAEAIAAEAPLFGAGFDGFRRECPDPRYFHGWGTDPQGAGAAMCVQHPHNFYLQALVEGGVPGLVLFAALAWSWLARLAAGLWHRPDPRRVGLFVAALIQLWPIASTTAWTSMPLAGWFFVLLGLGLAEPPPHMTDPTDRGPLP